ncbi:MAG: peptidoglycan DD-metalloendopeptidase family protein [Acidobacteria bacterium]|nr:peptidoglycan DD-metalloendopeptidase family protein [Acidobacteriota bacterium]
MSDDKRIHTFLIANGSSQFKQYSFNRNLIYYAGGSLLALTLGCGYGIFKVVQSGTEAIKYTSIKAENEKLKQENETYQNSYAKLKGQISYIGDVSKELARQAKMEPGFDLDKQLGTGGPETVAALDKTAGQLEQRVRTIGDALRAEQLKLATIPSGLPVNGYLTDDFGVRSNPFGGESHEVHQGLDIAAEWGTSVTATADGIVVIAGPHSGYGNLVSIYHSNGITTRFGHLSKINVEVGQRVKRGDLIGNVGSTGRSTGPHVHYEVRENDVPVDPQRYVAQK